MTTQNSSSNPVLVTNKKYNFEKNQGQMVNG